MTLPPPPPVQRDWYMAQQEIISQLLPLFITNHPTYSALLQEAWHGAVSCVVMRVKTEQIISPLLPHCFQYPPPSPPLLLCSVYLRGGGA